MALSATAISAANAKGGDTACHEFEAQLGFHLARAVVAFSGSAVEVGAASMTAETAPEWTATRRLAWERQRDAVTEKSQFLESFSRETLESLHNRESTIPARESTAAAHMDEQRHAALAKLRASPLPNQN